MKQELYKGPDISKHNGTVNIKKYVMPATSVSESAQVMAKITWMKNS